MVFYEPIPLSANSAIPDRLGLLRHTTMNGAPDLQFGTLLGKEDCCLEMSRLWVPLAIWTAAMAIIRTPCDERC